MNQQLSNQSQNRSNQLVKKDSLCCSQDGSSYYDDRFSFNTQNSDINFAFEDENFQEPFYYQNASDRDLAKQRRRVMFQKFKHKNERKSQQNRNDVVKIFDQVFCIENKKQHEDIDPIKSDQVNDFTKKKIAEASDITHQFQLTQNKYNKNLVIKQQNKQLPINDEDFFVIHKGPKRQQISNKFQNSEKSHSKQQQQKNLTCTSLNEQNQISQKTINTLVSQYEIQKSKNIQCAQNIEDSQSLSKIQHPIYLQQQRIPQFIRTVRKLNSIYPNLLNKDIDLGEQGKKLNELCTQLGKSLKVLYAISKQTIHFFNKAKQYNPQMSKLSYFLHSGWEKHQPIKNLQLIQPKINLRLTNISPDKILQTLQSYGQVIEYYRNYAVDLKTNEGRQKYAKIRNKLWAVEKNLRNISEDIYKLALERQHPNYVYWYLNILKSQTPKLKEERIIEQHKKLLQILLTHRQNGDPLSRSEVGQAVKAKLERQLKLIGYF